MSPGDLAAAYCRALLYVRRGHFSGYRELCQSLLETSDKSQDARTQNAIAWTCALAPGAVSDYRRVLKLSEQAVEGCATDKRHIYLNTYGAVLYRAGKFEAAAEALRDGIEAHASGGETLDWILLALVHKQLGHEDEAVQWRDKALARCHAPVDPQDDPPSVWERIEVQLFRQEAGRLLAGELVDYVGLPSFEEP